MAIIKCKMCGGDLNITEGISVAECEYCGSMQTIPAADNEKKLALFTRASGLLRRCEFDKAAGVYEAIVADFSEEAEAYWGLVLCKYGIEYVDDPATGKKIPTCHRSSFESVMEEPNFDLVMSYSDPVSRKVYREEAKAIEELRKVIIEVSGKEEPYDIFICYKETAFDGNRTLDSVLAQDIYDALTEKGYRVFFARVSLEDKLGQEYEPYIFAALNSARIMLAIGTDFEHYNAVWVKNEWSRYLQLIAAGQKKTLIPCFKNLDPYDMPKEFAKLQSQDLGKVGAMQDLMRGIEKILPKKEEVVKERVIVQQSGAPGVDSLLRRGQMFLEDGDWTNADEYFDRVLDIDPECSEAYMGKALAEEKAKTLQDMMEQWLIDFENVESVAYKMKGQEERIRAAVQKYEIPDFFSRDDVEYFFRFTVNYSSRVKPLQAKKDKILEYWSGHKNLVKAKRFATGQIKAALDNAYSGLIAVMDRHIVAAENEAEKKAAEIKEEYARILDEAEERAAKYYEVACRQREEKYQSCCKKFEQIEDDSKLQALYYDFVKLGNYKESQVLAQKAMKKREWIKETRIKAEKEAVQARRLAYIAALEKEKANLQTELANLKGLFSGKRRKEIEARLVEIERQLRLEGAR